MARKAGSICKFTCKSCGEVSLVPGGNANFRCVPCRKKHGAKDTDSIQYKAHRAVAKAIKEGVLDRPALFDCVDCSKPAIEYDHRDYNKPLDVVPVCRRCNLLRGSAVNSEKQPA